MSRTTSSESVGQRVANDLRMRSYHHLQRLSLMYFQHPPSRHHNEHHHDRRSDDSEFRVSGPILVMFVDDCSRSSAWSFVMFMAPLGFRPFRDRTAALPGLLRARVRKRDCKATIHENSAKSRPTWWPSRKKVSESMEVVEAFNSAEHMQGNATCGRSADERGGGAEGPAGEALVSRPVVTLPIAVCTGVRALARLITDPERAP